MFEISTRKSSVVRLTDKEAPSVTLRLANWECISKRGPKETSERILVHLRAGLQIITARGGFDAHVGSRAVGKPCL